MAPIKGVVSLGHSLSKGSPWGLAPGTRQAFDFAGGNVVLHGCIQMNGNTWTTQEPQAEMVSVLALRGGVLSRCP